jgi:hypothetical protein
MKNSFGKLRLLYETEVIPVLFPNPVWAFSTPVQPGVQRPAGDKRNQVAL